jgi:hypothetical protein
VLPTPKTKKEKVSANPYWASFNLNIYNSALMVSKMFYICEGGGLVDIPIS